MEITPITVNSIPLGDNTNEINKDENQIQDIDSEIKDPDDLRSETRLPLNMAPGAVKLRSWLNKPLRIKMTDGRTLLGVFFCTDRDANIILGSCTEYLPADDTKASLNDEPRMLGLVMIPGRHIVKVELDVNENYSAFNIVNDQEEC
ncbi:unnamed protein product [Brassicogethes aeneus]|uniref:Sm domain-containing protein n=1 Tax=Brassicogethes aeneus TaxID=1431903 RepID=A0A9P0FJY4_BRAAE|nr:unnamed protein product [Brassicogethes aeneus]